MIFDELVNLKDYNIVPAEVYEFLNKLNVNTPCGKYDITDRIYANIESYERKSQVEATLESHRKYIDIQLLLSGTERIDCINIDGLETITNYDPDKDIIFYKRPKTELGSVILNGRNFAVFYPQDAHAPQITTMSLQNNVKKVVIKIAVDYI